MRPGWVALCACLVSVPGVQPPAAPDYAALFDKGAPFQEFLRLARSRRDEWVKNYREAEVAGDAIARVRAAGNRRRLLVVAEDWCGDSANTIPYLARLVEKTDGALSLHVVDATDGHAVTEAHQTPDGRAATPTVIVLDEENHVLGAWVERPSALQKWYLEQQSVLTRKDLLDRKYAWYAEDKGKSTIAEVVELIVRR